MVLPEVTSQEAVLTGNDVTGSHVNGSDRVRMLSRFPLFLTIVVVQNVLLRMTGSSMDT